MTPSNNDLVFDESQIGKGLKPLAQHGKVVISADGIVSLIDSNGGLIDSAHASDVTAKRAWYTWNQTVMLTLQDRKYNTTPGWGNRPGAIGGGSWLEWSGPVGTAKASKVLVEALEQARSRR
jgi:hypothetical protein